LAGRGHAADDAPNAVGFAPGVHAPEYHHVIAATLRSVRSGHPVVRDPHIFEYLDSFWFKAELLAKPKLPGEKGLTSVVGFRYNGIRL